MKYFLYCAGGLLHQYKCNGTFAMMPALNNHELPIYIGANLYATFTCLRSGGVVLYFVF